MILEINTILVTSLLEGVMKRSLWSLFFSVSLDRLIQLSSTGFLKWYLKPVWDKFRLRKSLFIVRGLSWRYSVRTSIRIPRMTRLDPTGRWSDIAFLNDINNATFNFRFILFIRFSNGFIWKNDISLREKSEINNWNQVLKLGFILILKSFSLMLYLLNIVLFLKK